MNQGYKSKVSSWAILRLAAGSGLPRNRITFDKTLPNHSEEVPLERDSVPLVELYNVYALTSKILANANTGTSIAIASSLRPRRASFLNSSMIVHRNSYILPSDHPQTCHSASPLLSFA